MRFLSGGIGLSGRINRRSGRCDDDGFPLQTMDPCRNFLLVPVPSITGTLLRWRQSAQFNSAFHAVSAFCNAGFSLFTDNLESWRSSPAVLFPVSFLIILGRLSFPVLSELIECAKSILYGRGSGEPNRFAGVSTNTKTVLSVTFLLLLSGTLFTYALEYGNTLRDLPLGSQYLNSFFQSATYRTAGFNTIPFGKLVVVSLMFIGRVGLLTIVSAAAVKKGRVVEYPRANMLIG